MDVGAKFDPATHRYDHHQREFQETMNSLQPDKKWTTKLSSAGLVYAHFGKEIIQEMTGAEPDAVSILYDQM